ncbi:hypothetical protein K502DRAFT_343461 [Neoconidiobolus thromboides FSU 785]|nr:hypothetical protein K502DRAFT_343461 [Neoconidiobolus thromboides FSU 785]
MNSKVKENKDRIDNSEKPISKDKKINKNNKRKLKYKDKPPLVSIDNSTIRHSNVFFEGPNEVSYKKLKIQEYYDSETFVDFIYEITNLTNKRHAVNTCKKHNIYVTIPNYEEEVLKDKSEKRSESPICFDTQNPDYDI